MESGVSFQVVKLVFSSFLSSTDFLLMSEEFLSTLKVSSGLEFCVIAVIFGEIYRYMSLLD